LRDWLWTVLIKLGSDHITTWSKIWEGEGSVGINVEPLVRVNVVLKLLVLQLRVLVETQVFVVTLEDRLAGVSSACDSVSCVAV